MPRTSEAAEAANTTKKESETVTVKLQMTREKQDDVFVSINGRTWKIQRGVEVEVPTYVKEVLDNSEKMDTLALARSRKLQKISK